MKNYIIRKVFNEDELKKVKELVNNSTNWIDGHHTQKWDKLKQTNFELDRNDPNFIEINKITMSSIDRDNEFKLFTFAEQSGPVIVSKYKKDSYFCIHEDDPTNGNFTTTIFLDDPKNYIGGELCLYLDGKEELIKLDAGYAITYNTGILHKVNTVDFGERNVIVFWSKSKKDPFFTELYSDISLIESQINKLIIDNNINIESNDLEFTEILNDPIFIIHMLKNKIIRKLIH